MKQLKEHPEGFNEDDLEVDFNAVAKAMKNSNAVVYRIELLRFELMSTAHRKALESYIPR